MASKQFGHNEIDMLHGPLLVKILTFALPLAASSVLQQLFNSVDVAVVGRFASSEALAAVGSNAPVINLLINLFVGISMGANAIISNHIGQNDRDRIRSAVSTSAVVALFSGIFLMALGVTVAKPIHSMMGTPVEVTNMAVSYLRIYFLGMPFIMIFNFGSAILRSLGDTKRPLYILIAAGILNTVLNLLFVIVFHMGVEGVAIATGISNLFSAAMVVSILLKEEEPYRLHPDNMRIQREELSHMLEIGVPAGLQGVVFSISNVIIQASINSYGFNAVAGSAAALNFEQYCYYVIAAFNGAAISFVGQNYGAGNMDRVKRIFLICMGLGTVSCAALNWIFAGWSDFFLGLFTDSEAVKEFGTIRMRTALVLQGLACLYEIPGSALRGMGRSMLPTLLTVFGTCLLRIAWVYTICPIWKGFHALMFVYPVSWTITGIMVMTAFIVTFKKIRKKAELSGAA